jgi:hypothetical protein
VRLDAKGFAVAGDDARIAAAVSAAKQTDLVIAVVGERESQSGEARIVRSSISRPATGTGRCARRDWQAGGGRAADWPRARGARAVESPRAPVHAFFPASKAVPPSPTCCSVISIPAARSR